MCLLRFAALTYVFSSSLAAEQQEGLLCEETSLIQVEQKLNRRNGDRTADQKDVVETIVEAWKDIQGYDPNGCTPEACGGTPRPMIDAPVSPNGVADYRPDHTSESWPKYPTGYVPFNVGKGGEQDIPMEQNPNIPARPMTPARVPAVPQTRGQDDVPKPILTGNSITWEYDPGDIAFDGTYNGFHWLVNHMPGPKNKYMYYLERGDLYFKLNDGPPKQVPKIRVKQKNRAPQIASVLKTWPIGADPAFEALPYMTAGVVSFKDSDSPGASETAQFITGADRHTVVSKLYALCHRARYQSCVMQSSWPHDSTNLGNDVPRSGEIRGTDSRLATHGAGSKSVHGAGSKSVQAPRSSRDHSSKKLATHGAGSKSVSGSRAQTAGGLTYGNNYEMYSAARWPSTALMALAVSLTVGSLRDLLP